MDVLSTAEIRRSVTPEALISFIDGRYKTLKRHLAVHGLSPFSYRERYGLPADYPMVAPAYGEARSQIAKSIGLGRPSGA
nr:MucR family transcriptional regulator [Methylobacterium soli]